MKALILCAIVLSMTALVLAKHCKKKHFTGCKLSSRDCVCSDAHECQNPFPYKNEKECLDDLHGLGNKCADNPCRHGSCVQYRKKNGNRKWECECAGSGYFGKRCQHKCPEKFSDPLPEDYPTACIMLENESEQNEISKLKSELFHI